jgi:hypothetical protein
MGVVADGNLYGRRDDGSPRWLVVWSSGEGHPEVFTNLRDFRRRTGAERNGRVVTAPLVDSYGHGTALLAKLTGATSRPLPDAVAAAVGQPPGTRHLGTFLGRKRP